MLRIEDTDRERSEKKYEEEILFSLRWLGLEWDGEPIRQSERIDRYREAAAELIAKGLAYESVEDGKKAVRFRMPKQNIKFKDVVRDEVVFDSSIWEDLVIMKSDGYPTYHFAVVVDDHDMGVTHVIRGDDHLTNTPKHILLYLAMGWKPPKYAHLPLIMGADGTPLSKRHGAVAAADYRDEGYLPQAMLNYLALLGWGPEGNEEVFTLPLLIKKFSLKRITKSNARFNPEKLLWINSQHLKNLSDDELVRGMTEYWGARGNWPTHPQWQKIVKLYKTRARTWKDLEVQAGYVFSPSVELDSHILKEMVPNSVMKSSLEAWLLAVQGVDFDRHEAIEQMTRSVAERLKIQAGDLIHPLRFAISGCKVSPGLFELMQVIGKETCISRVQNLIEQAARL